jgi:hypothetical protein
MKSLPENVSRQILLHMFSTAKYSERRKKESLDKDAYMATGCV